MREKHESSTVVDPQLSKTERALIQLYRTLPRHDRRHLRRVMLVMIKAALKRP
jgi:hypothetical protein